MSFAALVEFFLTQPEAAAKLLKQHVDDGSGHCRVCTLGGQQGHMIWPCTTHSSAVDAERIRRGARPIR